jgi:hypothetical protein
MLRTTSLRRSIQFNMIHQKEEMMSKLYISCAVIGALSLVSQLLRLQANTRTPTP